MSREQTEYVKLEEVTIGSDSDSGLAVLVTINDKSEWVPYSQIKSLTRTHNKGADTLEVARWLAEKRGWL